MLARWPSVKTRYTTRNTPASRSASACSVGTTNAIPVSVILRRARTSRLVRVGSGSRNTAAIWAALSPHTARKVSATRTAGSSAG